MDSIPTQLELVDTAGSECFKALRYNYMSQCYGFMLVFDVTRSESLNELKEYVEAIQRLKYDDLDEPLYGTNTFPCVIIGNKCDLIENMEITQASQVQSFVEMELGMKHVPFFWTSAREYINIKESFHELVRQMRIFSKLQNGQYEPIPEEEKGRHRLNLESELKKKQAESLQEIPPNVMASEEAAASFKKKKKSIFASYSSTQDGQDISSIDDGL